MKIQVAGFKGMVPALSTHLLPVPNAQTLIDGKISKGDLRAFRRNLFIETIQKASVQTIFQYEENSNVNWVSFSEDVDHFLSPLAGEIYERLYFSGLSEPRVFANDLVSGSFDPDTDYYKLGVPAPEGSKGPTKSPTSNCTDPVDDQNNTTGWTAQGGAVLSSEAGGVNGYRLKVASAAGFGYADDEVTVVKGRTYLFRARASADLGDTYFVQIRYVTEAEYEYDSGFVAGQGAGVFDYIEHRFVAQHSDAVFRISIGTGSGTAVNAYFDDVILYEMDSENTEMTIPTGTTSTGTATTDTTNKLVDTGATFQTDGVQVGDLAYNTTDELYAKVTAVDSETSLSLDSDAFPDGNENYEVGPNYGTGSDYRAYLFIYVTAYTEKGAATGDVASISDYGFGPVRLTDIFDVPPEDRRIDRIYIYRTSSSGAGTTTYRFVLEAKFFSILEPYAVGEYVVHLGELYKCTTDHSAGEWDPTHFEDRGDDVDENDLATDTLESETWDPPPANLKGLTILPTGIAAGFVGNEIYLSEPYQVHAWPPEYTISIPYKIVGLGTYGNNLVVATNGEPYTISGLTPSQMYPKKGKGSFPCLSKRGVVSSEFGVQFPIKEGMLRINENGTFIDTAGKIDILDWENYFPATMAGIVFAGKYYGCFRDDDNVYHGFFIDYNTEDLTLLDAETYCFYTSLQDGELYLGQNDVYDEADPPPTKPLCVKKYEGNKYNYTYFKFKTKKFLVPFDTNFCVARIMYDEEFYAELLQAIADDNYLADQNATIFAGDVLGAVNDDPVNTLPIHGDLLLDLSGVSASVEIKFRVYADGELKFTKNVMNTQPFRLNSGYKSKRYEFQLEGNIPIKKMDIATSVEELLQ